MATVVAIKNTRHEARAALFVEIYTTHKGTRKQIKADRKTLGPSAGWSDWADITVSGLMLKGMANIKYI